MAALIFDDQTITTWYHRMAETDVTPATRIISLPGTAGFQRLKTGSANPHIIQFGEVGIFRNRLYSEVNRAAILSAQTALQTRHDASTIGTLTFDDGTGTNVEETTMMVLPGSLRFIGTLRESVNPQTWQWMFSVAFIKIV